MRYGPEHKASIHREIVTDASKRIRSGGVGGAAVSVVMRDAGLTPGGFYKHFESKDQLLMESLSRAFEEVGDRLVEAGKKAEPTIAWKAIVKTYLSMEYCDHAEDGCPLPALAPELARMTDTLKPTVFEELNKYRIRLLPFMPGKKAAEKERAFFVIFSSMIGAVGLARLLPESSMRKAVLDSVREHLLQSFGS